MLTNARIQVIFVNLLVIIYEEAGSPLIIAIAG